MEEAFNTIAAISMATSASGPLMDRRIWRNVPQGLLDRVLTFLPPPSFFRSRAVCKRWYALLFSDTFLEAHLRLSPGRPWFAFFLLPPRAHFTITNPSAVSAAGGSGGGSVTPPALLFDPESASWHRLPFHPIIPPGFSPAASSGGLVCWISDDAGTKTVILCNPLSRLAAQLPSSPRPRLFPSVGLTAGHSSFSVVVAGDDLISPFAVKNLTAETFLADGVTGFYSPWATVSPLPRLCNLDPGRMVFAGGRFYCVSTGPFAVLAYDVASNAWFKIQAPMRRFLRSPSLAECDGRVLLVAAVEKSKLSVPRSVRVWGLQDGGEGWVEVERMPPDVYAQFGEAEGGRGFECVGHGDFISVTIKGSVDILMFDLYRKVWWWAPPCPFLCGGAAAGGLRGFAYEPRLATPALGLLGPSSLAFQAFSG